MALRLHLLKLLRERGGLQSSGGVLCCDSAVPSLCLSLLFHGDDCAVFLCLSLRSYGGCAVFLCISLRWQNAVCHRREQSASQDPAGQGTTEHLSPNLFTAMFNSPPSPVCALIAFHSLFLCVLTAFHCLFLCVLTASTAFFCVFSLPSTAFPRVVSSMCHYLPRACSHCRSLRPRRRLFHCR